MATATKTKTDLATRMKQRRVHTAPIRDLTHGKADTGHGWIEGYLAVYEIVDQVDEVFRSGAFAKSAAEVVPALKVPLMVRHLAYGGDAPETVGVVTAARDEERGLWIHAEFFSDDAAQTVRKRIIEARDAGADELYRLSVGYQTVRWDVVEQDGKEIVELFEAKLLDATITVMPCNPDAIITAAKSITDATDVAALRNAVGVLTAMIGDDGTTVPQTPDPGGDAHPEPRRLYTTRAKVLRRRLALTLIGAVGS